MSLTTKKDHSDSEGRVQSDSEGSLTPLVEKFNAELPQGFRLRPARLEDQAAITELIARVQINPNHLEWPRFWLVVDEADTLAACAQIKRQFDDSRELASIATVPELQGRGLATVLIRFMLARSTPPLYLGCRSHMEAYYQRFGFRTISWWHLPPYFKKRRGLRYLFRRLMGCMPKVLTMKWEG